MSSGLARAWTPARSRGLYAAPSACCPGGVNSPVRAMRSIGRDHPIFIERGEGFELIDADGHRYVDWVCSWGPLILGHAHPAVVDGGQRRRRAGHQLWRADRGRGRAGGGGPRAHPVGGDGADGQLRHRGLDERPAPRARGNRPRQGREVRGRLPRTRGWPARRGRLRARDAGDPGQPGRDRGAGGRHAGRALERPRRRSRRPCPDIRSPRSSASRSRRTWGWSRRMPASSSSCASRPTPHDALLVFDEVITGFRVARGGAQELYGVSPDLTVLGKVLGGGLPAAAFGGRRELMERVAPAGDVYQAGTLSGNPLAVAGGARHPGTARRRRLRPAGCPHRAPRLRAQGGGRRASRPDRLASAGS